MGISIASVQKENLSFLDTLGGNEFEELPAVHGTLMYTAKELIKNIGKYAEQRKVVASGKLLDKTELSVVDENTIHIKMPDYFDYPNEGVKGVKSSKNAPGSPYQFKTYGMNAEGRAEIKKYIKSGKAKIDLVRKNKDKALGIGLEKKRLSIADAKANQLIYLIKRQGIKKTNYFNDAVKETMKDFESNMGKAFGNDIALSISKYGNN